MKHITVKITHKHIIYLISEMIGKKFRCIIRGYNKELVDVDIFRTFNVYKD